MRHTNRSRSTIHASSMLRDFQSPRDFSPGLDLSLPTTTLDLTLFLDYILTHVSNWYRLKLAFSLRIHTSVGLGSFSISLMLVFLVAVDLAPYHHITLLSFAGKANMFCIPCNVSGSSSTSSCGLRIESLNRYPTFKACCSSAFGNANQSSTTCSTLVTSHSLPS